MTWSNILRVRSCKFACSVEFRQTNRRGWSLLYIYTLLTENTTSVNNMLILIILFGMVKSYRWNTTNQESMNGFWVMKQREWWFLQYVCLFGVAGTSSFTCESYMTNTRIKVVVIDWWCSKKNQCKTISRSLLSSNCIPNRRQTKSRLGEHFRISYIWSLDIRIALIRTLSLFLSLSLLYVCTNRHNTSTVASR